MELKHFGADFKSLHYIIQEDGVRIVKKGISKKSDTFVDFEDVGSKVIKEQSRKILWLCLAVLFLIIAVAVFISRMRGNKVGDGAELFHLTVSSLFLGVFFLTRKKNFSYASLTILTLSNL